jgi:hypothetical protein
MFPLRLLFAPTVTAHRSTVMVERIGGSRSGSYCSAARCPGVSMSKGSTMHIRHSVEATPA